MDPTQVYSTSDVIPDDDIDNDTENELDVNEAGEQIDGLDFICTFLASQKLNDYLNKAIDDIENHDHDQENLSPNDENFSNPDSNHDNLGNGQNQENNNPNSRYVCTKN